MTLINIILQAPPQTNPFFWFVILIMALIIVWRILVRKDKIMKSDKTTSSIVKINEQNMPTIPANNNKINVLRIKTAGMYVQRIFKCIIFQLVLVFSYWFLIGFKIGYGAATNSFNINEFQEYSNWLYFIFGVIELVICFTFLKSLWQVGKHLMDVDKNID